MSNVEIINTFEDLKNLDVCEDIKYIIVDHMRNICRYEQRKLNEQKCLYYEKHKQTYYIFYILSDMLSSCRTMDYFMYSDFEIVGRYFNRYFQSRRETIEYFKNNRNKFKLISKCARFYFTCSDDYFKHKPIDEYIKVCGYRLILGNASGFILSNERVDELIQFIDGWNI